MKRILIIQVFLLTVTWSIGQTYPPFLQNIGWCVEEYFGTGSVMNAYENNGDTTIGAISYSKLMQNETLFLVREDTDLKKVWVILPDSTNETLLYDFSISVGSQINLTYIGGVNVPHVVGYIDSVNTPLGPRKRITLGNSDTSLVSVLYWVEGIGSTFSPLYLYDRTYSTGGIGYCLICSYQSIGIQSYSGMCGIPCISLPGGPCYPFIVGIQKAKTETKSFSILREPNQIVIQSNLSDKFEIIRIISIQGKILYSQHGINKETVTISVNSWPNGIYLVEATMQHGKVITKKLAL